MLPVNQSLVHQGNHFIKVLTKEANFNLICFSAIVSKKDISPPSSNKRQ
jgi:hypothetical protein